MTSEYLRERYRELLGIIDTKQSASETTNSELEELQQIYKHLLQRGYQQNASDWGLALASRVWRVRDAT